MNTIQKFDYAIDIKKALLWQDEDATKIKRLMNYKQEFITQHHVNFWANWYTNVFRLTTANTFGLEVWSIILNTPLSKGEKPDPPNKPIFGFASEDETPTNHRNFDNGNFTNSDGGIILTPEEKRLLLRLRYIQLTSSGSIFQTNEALAEIFKAYGPCYLLDDVENMAQICVFGFEPGDRLLTILKEYDLIPRPEGVDISYRITSRAVFGFASETEEPNGKKNFDNGTFITEDL